MADGGEVSGRTDDSNKKCSPCITKGTEREAVNYCFMCEASFCQDCTEQHSVFLSKHRVTEIESEEVGVALVLQTEPCPKHGKALNLYCKEDNTIGCELCIAREHISCKRPIHLPTSAQDVLKDIDVSELESKLRRTIEHLECVKIKQHSTLASLQAERSRNLQEINDQHTELQDIIDNIVKSSKYNVEHTFERFSSELQRHRQEVEKCHVDLKSCEKRLEQTKGNDFQLFMELKKCENQLIVSEEVSKDFLENPNVKGFPSTVDDRLHNLLRELQSLDTVLNQASTQVKKTKQIDVSGKGGCKTCSIYGSCVLYDGSILLADHSNKMLKRVDQHTLKVKDQCQMQSVPIDVCVINSSEVAVTQDNTAVVIVSVRPRLTPIRTISMNHHCAYVTCSHGELLITDVSKILYIYNMEGSLLRTISTDSSGQDIFSKTRHVIVSAASDRMFIADCDKGLLIINREGHVQHKLVSDKIRRTFGLCLDGMGGLFVCGYDSNNVLHLGADGQILTEVLTSSDGLVKPVSVCYDILHKRLFVTQFDSNQVHVCEFV